MMSVPKGYNDFSLVRQHSVGWLPFRFVYVSAFVLHGRKHYRKELFSKMNYGYRKIDLWIALNHIF